MARKRKGLEHLDYNSKEYWNRVLASKGLSMDRGRDPRLIIVGDTTDLSYIEGARRMDDGRTRVPRNNES